MLGRSHCLTPSVKQWHTRHQAGGAAAKRAHARRLRASGDQAPPLADHDTVKQAVDAFVTAVLAPRRTSKRTEADEPELDLLNPKIKGTVAMLADPAFDGLDELRITLAHLKAKRNALATRTSRQTNLRQRRSAKSTYGPGTVNASPRSTT